MYLFLFHIFNSVQVKATGYHTALLVREKKHTKVITWGCNDDGVLGRVTKDEEEGDPAVVAIENVCKVAVGNYHMCVLTTEVSIQ